jgi:hypothetical protein
VRGGVRGGGQQLTVWGGRTRRHGARGVVEAVGEGPEPAVRDGLAMASKAAPWRRSAEEEEEVVLGAGRGGGRGRPL